MPADRSRRPSRASRTVAARAATSVLSAVTSLTAVSVLAAGAALSLPAGGALPSAAAAPPVPALPIPAPPVPAPPVPAAPAPGAPPLELASGSAQTLGGTLAGQFTGQGIGPSVLAGSGTGPAEYVALGDSYAAVGKIAPGSWAPGPVACVRTDDAYPTVVARELGVGRFVNATCGGAVADDFWTPGRTGAPPQLDALSENTDLVTMTIGGNDVGFGAVIVACALRPNTAPELLPLVDAATGRMSEGFDPAAGCSDVLDTQAPAALAELDQQLDEVYAAIAERSPNARVVTVGYLAAVPEEDRIIRESPSCAPFLAISPEERAKVRGFQDGINRVVRDAAERNGATAVIPDEPGHSMCTGPGTRWVDFTGLETGAVPVHPTTAGHAHVANRVVASHGR